ncbi:hypothetical protein ILUMI_06057 [Ignelater luminosus]|uniref:Fatty acid-binding protein, muscle n=1 Tax=Ignelater luminosus TaxID=2038154 RepID=A0A8K0D9B1_IGNLU|nr:hypothetical protein ILUMI_06057 [Ignelater luminosus]
MALDAFLGKKYKLESSENFDEYLKAIGVNIMLRKVANTASPVVELTKSGDQYTISSVTTFRTIVVSFKDGVEFETDTVDGRKVKSTITVDGTTLHEVQKDASGKEHTIDRLFSENEIKMVLKYDDIVCIRIYKSQ